MKFLLTLAFLSLASLSFAAPPPHTGGQKNVAPKPGPHAPAPVGKKAIPQPRPKNANPYGGTWNKTPNYHTKFGHKFKHGYYYRGHQHNHWTQRYWDNRYGTFLYYDPCVKGYYYWCAPHFCYYPVSYAPVGYVFPYVANPVPPAVEVQPPVVETCGCGPTCACGKK